MQGLFYIRSVLYSSFFILTSISIIIPSPASCFTNRVSDKEYYTHTSSQSHNVIWTWSSEKYTPYPQIESVSIQQEDEITLAQSTETSPFANESKAWGKDRLATEDRWKFHVGLYLWVPAMSGNVTVKGLTARIDGDLGDTLDALNFALTGHFEAWKGRWIFLFDGMYVDLENDASNPLGKVTVKIKQAVIDVGGGYRIFDISFKKDPALKGGFRNNSLAFDALAGFRYFYVDQEIDGRFLNPSLSRDWIEPFVGGRFLYRIYSGLSLLVRGDIGGFDISGSQLTGNFMSVLMYQFVNSKSRFWSNSTIFAGYRFLGFDYEDSNPSTFKMDLQLQGPIITFIYTF